MVVIENGSLSYISRFYQTYFAKQVSATSSATAKPLFLYAHNTTPCCYPGKVHAGKIISVLQSNTIFLASPLKSSFSCIEASQDALKEVIFL